MFNCANGAYMKPAVGHSSELTHMRYCKEDRCLLSVGWDGKILVRRRRLWPTLAVLRRTVVFVSHAVVLSRIGVAWRAGVDVTPTLHWPVCTLLLVIRSKTRRRRTV